MVCVKCEKKLKYEWADCGSEATEDWLECECGLCYSVDKPHYLLGKSGKKIKRIKAKMEVK